MGMDQEQLTIDGETELIPGAQRDENGKVVERWIRLTRTTGGCQIAAPDDVKVSSMDNSAGTYLTVFWPHARQA